MLYSKDDLRSKESRRRQHQQARQTVVAAVLGDAKGLNNNPRQHNLLLEFLIEFSNLCHIHFEAELELFWLGSNFL